MTTIPETEGLAVDAGRKPDPNCPICSNSSFGIPGCLVLDALQVPAARQRWQWATLSPGANDCPCIQAPPTDTALRNAAAMAVQS